MNEVTRSGRRGLPWGVFGDDLDDFLAGFMRPGNFPATGGKGMVPAMDVVEHDHEYLVKAELPGVRKEDIELTIQDNVLTINAETRRETEEKQGGRVIRQERQVGKYVRSMRLGSQVDESRVKASYNDGVLELVLPKVEEVRPKKINVDVR